jgi:predicted metalloprotease
MQWKGRRESENVEDRRGAAPGLVLGGGLGGIIILLLVLLLGGDPSKLLEQMKAGGPVAQQPGGPAPGPVDPNDPNDERAKFIKVVLADTEDVWRELFQRNGLQYREPKLVLFSGRVQSACGFATAASGPFYCPADEKVYIDLAFYDELKSRFGAAGDFAQAYVLAHEVGHHVQKLLGTMDKVHGLRNRLSESENNQLSVRLELQADFYAGVWAHHAQRMKNVLEQGDIEEAMAAAAAVGDDRIQQQAQGYVVPDAFTHGTSEQRVKWFRKGLESGDLRQGDTFNLPDP